MKLRTWLWLLLIVATLLAALACESSDPRNDEGDDDAAGTDSTTGGTDADADADTDGDSDTDADTDAGGCKGVDFLFAIDSSVSMGDEQANLIASFPGFIQAISETLGLDDFHIMVVDSDSIYEATSALERRVCANAGCCTTFCDQLLTNPYDECSATGGSPFYTCKEWSSGDPAQPDCDELLGGACVGANTGASCALDGGGRYIVEGQTDLTATFSCIANVGVNGNGYERLMESMALSVGPFAGPGGCNDGFVRDDAILVVTFITDENEACNTSGEVCSAGDPASWKQSLVDAKGGNENAVVVLGVFGDNDLPTGLCGPYDPAEGIGAEPAPRLRTFLDSFGERGHYCSVCLDNYNDCFLAAVSTIDTTCDQFIE